MSQLAAVAAKLAKVTADRMKEPSSWAGLAPLLALGGYNLDPGAAQFVAYIGAGLAGIASIVLPEGSKA